MKDTDQTTRRKGSSFFPQEMQQAFADWVKKLPFMKRNTRKDAEQGHEMEKSADLASTTRPAGSGSAGRPPDKEGKSR